MARLTSICRHLGRSITCIIALTVVYGCTTQSDIRFDESVRAAKDEKGVIPKEKCVEYLKNETLKLSLIYTKKSDVREFYSSSVSDDVGRIVSSSGNIASAFQVTCENESGAEFAKITLFFDNSDSLSMISAIAHVRSCREWRRVSEGFADNPRYETVKQKDKFTFLRDRENNAKILEGCDPSDERAMFLYGLHETFKQVWDSV
jgi:hypothetical protein